MSSKPSKPDIVSNVKLNDVLANLATSIIKAKETMDETSLEISKKYAKDETLSSLSIPFFTISEVNLHLKAAINEFDKSKEVMVSVDTETLQKLPQHVILEIDLKLSPSSGTLYKTSEGKAVLNA